MIIMTKQQKEELWFLLLDWKDSILEEDAGRLVDVDSIDEVVEKIENIIKGTWQNPFYRV